MKRIRTWAARHSAVEDWFTLQVIDLIALPVLAVAVITASIVFHTHPGAGARPVAICAVPSVPSTCGGGR